MRIFLSLLVLLTISTPSFAAKTSTEEATKLAKIMKAFLEYNKNVNESLESMKFKYTGDIKVVPNDTFYSITLPHISLETLEQTEGAKITFDLGVITMNASKDTTKTGMWKIALTVPKEITMKDSEGEIDFKITSQDQKIAAALDERLGYFTKINFNMSDIKFIANGKDSGAKIGGVQFYQNLDEKEPGIYSGDSFLLLSNLFIQEKDKPESVSIDELKLNISMDKARLPTLKEYEKKFLAFAEQLKVLIEDTTIDKDKKGAEATQEKAASEKEKTVKMVNALIDLYNIEMNGFGFEYILNGLKANNIKTSPLAPSTSSYAMDHASFGLTFSDLLQEKGEMTFSTKANGYSGDAIPADFVELIPDNTNITLKAENVPYAILYDLAINSAQSITNNPESATMVGTSAILRLPGILSQNGTKISIDGTNLSNNTYNVTTTGSITADVTSMLSFTLKANMMFAGLDKLISLIDSKLSEDTQGMNTFTLAPLKQSLTQLKTLGKANDKGAYSFDVESTPQGQILVNGQDPMTALMATPPQ